MNAMNKLSFGVSAVVSGQRKISYKPELVALTTLGGFRITPAISKALGIQHGDNIAFVKNVDQVEQAIITRDAAFVDWCGANGFSADDESAAAAFHKEYDFWGLVKGYALFNDKGIALTVAERMSKSDRENFVRANYSELYAQAINEGSDELKSAIESAEGDEETIIGILAQAYSPEKPKFAGSKTANSSNMLGTGVVLNFTDSNVWAQVTEGKAKSDARSFPIDVDSLVKVEVYDGCKAVEVSCLPFDPTVFEDRDAAREAKAE